jgi:hypothetical protein
MTSLLFFCVSLLFRIVGKIRMYLYAFGGGMFGFFLLQSYGQWNAYFTYNQLTATAVKIETGCLERNDFRRNRIRNL